MSTNHLIVDLNLYSALIQSGSCEIASRYSSSRDTSFTPI